MLWSWSEPSLGEFIVNPSSWGAGETKYPAIYLGLNRGKTAVIFEIRDREWLLCLMLAEVFLFLMYVHKQPGFIKRKTSFLNSWQRACWWSSPVRPCVYVYECECVCVCYCCERQSLASEVIRAAACLSLSLQPENTLLFRTTLTALLPLPCRLSTPLFSSPLLPSGLRKSDWKQHREGNGGMYESEWLKSDGKSTK